MALGAGAKPMPGWSENWLKLALGGGEPLSRRVAIELVARARARGIRTPQRLLLKLLDENEAIALVVPDVAAALARDFASRLVAAVRSASVRARAVELLAATLEPYLRAATPPRGPFAVVAAQLTAMSTTCALLLPAEAERLVRQVMRKLAPTMPRERNRRTREAIEATLREALEASVDASTASGQLAELAYRFVSQFGGGVTGRQVFAECLRGQTVSGRFEGGEFRPDAAGDSVAILTPDTATTLGLSHEPTHYAERGTAN